MSNVTGKPHDNDDLASIKKRLVDQIVSPVRWADDVQWLVDHVPGRYVEPAPGKVLTGLMRRINRKTKVENFPEPSP
jgi:[acyl-carrier-protein] S-malonyltransferase